MWLLTFSAFVVIYVIVLLNFGVMLRKRKVNRVSIETKVNHRTLQLKIETTVHVVDL